jgi:hypothetical protein
MVAQQHNEQEKIEPGDGQPAREQEGAVQEPVIPDDAADSHTGHATAAEFPAPVKKNTFARLFDADTRLGRFMRTLVRALALIVGLVALGALVTYLFFYRPVADQLRDASAEAEQLATQLQQREEALSHTEQELETVRAEAGHVQSQLDIELARVHALRAMNEVTQSRLALANQDPAAAARALNNAEQDLENLYPLLEQVDNEQVSTLQALFTLTKNDLNRDAALANQDLDRLQSELERVEQNILQSP